MVKHILLIRHGQGDHNLLFSRNKASEAAALRDPPINGTGMKQSSDLAIKLRNVIGTKFPLEVIISSPMKRALMTANIVFKNYPKVPFVVSPLPTEIGDVPCDFGSPKSTLEQEFPGLCFDGIEENWWPENETDKELSERARKFQDFLAKRPETYLAVVSHGQFLTRLTYDTDFCTFQNCECKQLTLDDEGQMVCVGPIRIRV